MISVLMMYPGTIKWSGRHTWTLLLRMESSWSSTTPSLCALLLEHLCLRDGKFSEDVVSMKTIYFRYPFHIGLQEDVIHPLTRGGLLTNLTTLADELRSEGYSTHAVGKWHLGSCNEDFLPTSRGFDHHYGYWLGAEDYYQHTRSQAGHKGYDFRDDLRVDHSAKGVYSSVLFGKKSSQIIENHNQSNPLFLYLPFQSPHAPLQAPKEYVKMYKSVGDKDRREYLGMITAMDDAIGRVIESLKKANMFENTIIVFLSDNGARVGHGGNNWPLRGMKNGLWEGGTRTPAFIHGPGLSPRVEHRMFHVTDWYPTILDIIKKKPTGPPMDGISAWKGLAKKSLNWKRNEIVYNLQESKDHPNNPTGAIRIGHWKFLWMVPGYDGWEEPAENRTKKFSHGKNWLDHMNDIAHTNQLFNLAEDPSEKNNLAEVEPERVLKMKAKLKSHLKTLMSPSYEAYDLAGTPRNGIWSTGWC